MYLALVVAAATVAYVANKDNETSKSSIPSPTATPVTAVTPEPIP